MCKLQPNYAYTVNSVCCRFLSNQCVHYATRTTQNLRAPALVTPQKYVLQHPFCSTFCPGVVNAPLIINCHCNTVFLLTPQKGRYSTLLLGTMNAPF